MWKQQAMITRLHEMHRAFNDWNFRKLSFCRGNLSMQFLVVIAQKLYLLKMI
jgi:hypothetical protein